MDCHTADETSVAFFFFYHFMLCFMHNVSELSIGCYLGIYLVDRFLSWVERLDMPCVVVGNVVCFG